MSLLSKLSGHFQKLFAKQSVENPYPEDITEVIPDFYDSVPRDFIARVLELFAQNKHEQVINAVFDVTATYKVPETDDVKLCVRRAYYAGGGLCLDADIMVSRRGRLFFRGGSVILLNMRKRTIPTWFAACVAMPVAELEGAGNEDEIMDRIALSKISETHLRAVYLSTKDRIGHGPYFLDNSTHEQIEDALQFCLDNGIEIVTPLNGDPKTSGDHIRAELDRMERDSNITTATTSTEKDGE